MERIAFEFAAGPPPQGRSLAGVVGSGDLEVLMEPNTSARTVVSITTSVDGFGNVWEALLTRMLGQGDLPAVTIEINDFGATPGVVRLRIAQAFEELATTSGAR